MFEELLGCAADELYEKAQPLAETLSSEEMEKMVQRLCTTS